MCTFALSNRQSPKAVRTKLNRVERDIHRGLKGPALNCNKIDIGAFDDVRIEKRRVERASIYAVRWRGGAIRGG